MCSSTFSLKLVSKNGMKSSKKMDLEKLFSVVSMLSNALSGKVQTSGREGGTLGSGVTLYLVRVFVIV